MTELYKNKKWLEEQISKYGNVLNTARNTGYNRKTIAKYLKVHEIENPKVNTRSRKYDLNESYFEKIDTEEKAYWLGFLVADGCLYHDKTSYDIQINLKAGDLEHLGKFAKAISAEQVPMLKGQGKKKIAFFRISSKKMFSDLEKLGCTPRKTGKEVWPKIRKSLIRHFLRGYFDGDGCISLDSKRKQSTFNVVCANDQFLQETCDYLHESTGESFSIYKVKGNAYVISSVANRKNYCVYNHIFDGATVYLNRKEEKVSWFLREYSPQYK